MQTLRTLALVLVASFTIAVIAASAAAAEGAEGVTLTASETGGAGSNALKAFGFTMECPGSTYSGHKVGTAELLKAGATSATITPKYKEPCTTGPGNFPTTIDMNGCDYVAHLGNTEPAGNKEGKYAITFDLVCPEGKEVVTTIFTSATRHAENKRFCKISIKAQTGLKGAHATDTGTGVIDITGTVGGIHAAKANGGEDPLLCAAMETTTSELGIDVAVEGKDSEGEVLGVALSEKEGSEQGELEIVPVEGVTLTASETGGAGSNALKAFGFTMECPGSTYSGHKVGTAELLKAGATSATITPKYKEPCTTGPGNFPTTIDMNGCDYVAHLGNTEPAGNKEGKYAITFDLVCPEGKEVVTTIFTSATRHAENKRFCKISIKAQTGLKGAHATDTGTGVIDITGTVGGIHAAKANGGEDPLLCAAMETTTSELGIDVAVEGKDSEGEVLGVALSEKEGSEQGELEIVPVEGVTLTASETGGAGSNALKAFGFTMECPGSTYSGHKVGTAELLKAGATSATITPKYKEPCTTGPGNFPTTIDMNGCDYVAHLGNTEPAGNKEGKYAITFDLVCPEGKEVVTTIFTSATRHAENKRFCKISIKAQTGLKGAHATDTGTGVIDITGTVGGIHAAKANGGEDPLLCAAMETTTSELGIDVAVEGKDSEGEVLGVALSEKEGSEQGELEIP